MAERTNPCIIVPGDEPMQIADSPHLESLRSRGEVVVHSDHPESAAEQVRRAQRGNIVINSRGRLKWPAEVLRQLPNLQMITTCSIGTDSVDLAAARESGIVVSNVPGLTAPVVAEHAIALMLAVAKRLAYQTFELKNGRWTARYNVLLAGKTLGILGAGSTAAATARLATAIGMRVQAWTYHPSADRGNALGVEFVEWEQLLRSSDVISIHLRLTPESRHLISTNELQKMKPGAMLINTARGPIVDTIALAAALQSGRLAGAGLDVFESEPPSADDPILGCEQVVLSPHHADQTPEGIDFLNLGAVENVLAFLNGQPQNVVT